MLLQYIEGMINIRKILLSLVLITSMIACANDASYTPNSKTPHNIRPDYYKQLVDILNKINKNMLEERDYTDEEHNIILRYFMVSNSKTDEEFNIKAKLAMLDTNAYQFFKTKDENIRETNLKMYQEGLKEIEEILKLHE